MSTKSAFIEKHSVWIYYALAFAISWSGILLVIGPGAFTGATAPTEARLPLVFLAMFSGPTVAGLLMTGLVHGKAGFRELLSRLLTWRVRARWYAAALVLAPLLMLAVLLALSRFSAGYLPAIFVSDAKLSVLLTGIMAGLMTGVCEEIGWMGFAMPALRRRHGVLATGLIMGVLWGAWHYPLFSGGDLSGALPLALFLPVQLFTFLPAFRVLMVWIYDRTRSLLVAMLMHASLTASTLILQPADVAGMPGVTYNLTLTAAFSVLIVAIGAVKRGYFSRPNASGANRET